MLTKTHETALLEAFKRVYPELDKESLEIEFLWTLRNVRYAIDGSIFWRGFELGHKLFMCLAEAQNWRCCYCGIRTNEYNDASATIEHVIPKSRGGLDHPKNMVMACRVCNEARS